MSEDWLGRWSAGKTGWHEADGNAGLKSHWPVPPSPEKIRERVLVPLCGKTMDLLWLVHHGYEVVGVELAEIAVRQFFAENDLEFDIVGTDGLQCFAAQKIPLKIYCGDYLAYTDTPFDALYDRGALVALPPTNRQSYVQHSKHLLIPKATKMIITMEYDQSVVAGPPFAILPAEVLGYWDDLRRVDQYDDIDNCPPKFRAAGLTDVQEVVWLSE